MRAECNPPWVDRVLSDYWKILSDTVGPKMMPVVEKTTRGGKRTFKEYGCGHYGCVIPTHWDNIVFKLTSDVSEVAFVAAAKSLPEWPDGMIIYHEIFELPVTYKKRRVFALWREEAHDIGFAMASSDDHYIRQSRAELRKNLGLFKDHANIVRNYLNRAKDIKSAQHNLADRQEWARRYIWEARPYHLRGADKAAVSLEHCKDLAEVMEHTYLSDAIGRALGFYLEHQMLLADVHLNNVGIVTRPPDEEYDKEHNINVITDPGHMVPLDPKWLDIPVPQLL